MFGDEARCDCDEGYYPVGLECILDGADGDGDVDGDADLDVDSESDSGFYRDADGDSDSDEEMCVPSPDLCNGLDDDCDPTTPDGADESWFGAPCDGGEDDDLCEEGIFECIDSAQACTDTTAHTPEMCNGEDDDCDPTTPDGEDEAWIGNNCDGDDLDSCEEGIYECSSGVQTCTDDTDDICNCPGHDEMVLISVLDVCIDRYEASRGVGLIPESVPDGIPWVRVRSSEAADACRAVGKRLCTEREWVTACQGPEGYSYPYGMSFDPLLCNDGIGGDDDGEILPTGAMSGCEGGYTGLFDMSGNVEEWTASCHTDTWGTRKCTACGGTNTFNHWPGADPEAQAAFEHHCVNGCRDRSASSELTATGFRCCLSH